MLSCLCRSCPSRRLPPTSTASSMSTTVAWTTRSASMSGAHAVVTGGCYVQLFERGALIYTVLLDERMGVVGEQSANVYIPWG